MKQKLLTILTLLLCICSGAWANQTSLITGVTLPDVPASSLDLSSQTTYTPDANGWIVFDPYTFINSVPTWWTYTSKNSLTNNDCSFTASSVTTTAPFVDATGTTAYMVNNNYFSAIRFTGAEKISFLIRARATSDAKRVKIALYTYDSGADPTQVIVGSVKENSISGFEEIKFESLTSATTYVAYIYNGGGSQNSLLREIALKAPVTSYNVTVAYNGAGAYGTASAALTTLAATATTTITAVPASGYKVASWSVEGTGASISPSGESNSTTTTLTMGTSDATVTCTFAAATTYTISYAAGSATGVTGSRGDETKTEDVTFTLPSTTVFSRTGYLQTGWNTDADGTSGTHYDLGGSYTTNAAQTFYPEWTALDYMFLPSANSGSLSDADVITTSTGGKMVATISGTRTTLAYGSTGVDNYMEFGIQSEGTGNGGVTVTLDKMMQAGTVIVAVLYWGQVANDRSLYLQNSSGTTKATLQLDATSAGESTTVSYTVVADDGLQGSNVFKLVRKNSVDLVALYVYNCADAYAITPAKAMTTYCNAEALNFTGVEGLTAYVVSAAENGSATLTPVTDVPASTGLILQGTAGTTYYVPVGSATTLGTTNKLVGVTSAREVAAWSEGSVYNYVLSDGQFHRASAGTLAAGKAYLHVDANPEGSNARSLSIIFEDEDVTSIDASIVNSEKSMVNSYYDLQGRKVAQPTRGLYIVNGKKVVVK